MQLEHVSVHSLEASAQALTPVFHECTSYYGLILRCECSHTPLHLQRVRWQDGHYQKWPVWLEALNAYLSGQVCSQLVRMTSLLFVETFGVGFAGGAKQTVQ